MESHVFEVEVSVKRPGQLDATAHREYRSQDAASTDKALSELLGGFTAETEKRLSRVQDEG